MYIEGESTEIDSDFSKFINPLNSNVTNETINENNLFYQVELISTVQLLIERLTTLESS